MRRSTNKRSAGRFRVRESRKFFDQSIVTQFALSVGLLLLAALGPVAELALSEVREVAPAELGKVREVTPSQVLQVALKLPQTMVTKATIKLDLAGISPAEFGDWEEPLR
jgi:hypothetical protein